MSDRMTEQEIADVARLVEVHSLMLMNADARRLLAEVRRLREVERAAVRLVASTDFPALSNDAVELDDLVAGAAAVVERNRARAELLLLLAGAA